MARRSPTSKFVGTTDECFADLFKNRTRRERYSLHKLLGDFCNVKAEAVSRWERGLQLIRGKSLVHLRCFLHLAGYEVAEVDGYQEPVRSLLLLTGLGVISDWHKLERDLGYDGSKEHTSLFRNILRNEGHSKDVGDRMVKICKNHEKELEKKVRDMGTEIRQSLKDLMVAPNRLVLSTAAPVQSEPPDPHVVASFAHGVRLVLSLSQPLKGNPEAAKAARRATRDGMDLQELKAVIEELLE